MDPSRRRYLAAVGAGGATGLAGCLGALGGPGDEEGDCDFEDDPEPVTELANPSMGDPDAPVVVRVWSDFACPHCADFSDEALPKIESEYVEPGDVRFEHHDYPIPVSEDWSWPAANAGRAVQDTTDDGTFFEYAHELFQSQGQFSYDRIQNLAEDVGADGCTARSAAANETYNPVLEADRGAGDDRGIRGTPAIFVDDEEVDFEGADTFYGPTKETIERHLDGN